MMVKFEMLCLYVGRAWEGHQHAINHHQPSTLVAHHKLKPNNQASMNMMPTISRSFATQKVNNNENNMV